MLKAPVISNSSNWPSRKLLKGDGVDREFSMIGMQVYQSLY